MFTFSSRMKSMLAVTAVAAAGAMAVPAGSSAAPRWATGAGTAVTTAQTVNLGNDKAGGFPITLTSSTGITVSCDLRATGTISPAGRDMLNSITLTNCTTNAPGCTVTGTVTNTPLQSQLYGTAFPLRDMIGKTVTAANPPTGTPITIVDTFSGLTCAVGNPVSLTFSGVLTPQIVNGAWAPARRQNRVYNNDAGAQCSPKITTAAARFDGAPAGVLAGPPGVTATVTGDVGIWIPNAVGTGCTVVTTLL